LLIFTTRVVKLYIELLLLPADLLLLPADLLLLPADLLLLLLLLLLLFDVLGFCLVQDLAPARPSSANFSPSETFHPKLSTRNFPPETFHPSFPPELSQPPKLSHHNQLTTLT
jgi:hypothetical protein